MDVFLKNIFLMKRSFFFFGRYLNLIMVCKYYDNVEMLRCNWCSVSVTDTSEIYIFVRFYVLCQIFVIIFFSTRKYIFWHSFDICQYLSSRISYFVIHLFLLWIFNKDKFLLNINLVSSIILLLISLFQKYFINYCRKEKLS